MFELPPVNGRISALEANVGQTLTAGAPVAIITPENTDLQAILLVPPRSAGFLDIGQDVNLLLDAFPYQKFGAQRGVIAEVSESPLLPGQLEAPVPTQEAAYRVRVALPKETIEAYGNEVPLRPGMTLVGDIVTDRRSLIEWMFEPLLTINRK